MDRIGLVVDLTGNQEAMASLKQLKRTADELDKRRINLTLDKAGLDKEIGHLTRNLRNLQNLKARIQIDGKDTTTVSKHIQDLKDKIAELTKQKNDINVDAKVNTEGLRQAKAELKELQSQAFGVRDALAGMGSVFSGIGGRLQSLGNAFGGNMLNTIKTTLTAYGTLMATQGLSTSISRYDTMTTFPKLMQQVGYSSKDAQYAIDKLNKSVLGLPTGLNEMVDSAKQYILATGDLEKGTDLAIAANNAFLANASDASQTAYGMRQIRDILSKGKLRAVEWDSLFTSLGTSIQPIAEHLGYASNQVGKFRTALQEGEITAMQFVNALIAVGTGTGELVQRVDIQKETLNATLSNIKNAFSILGYNVLTELNGLFKEYTGKSLPENIKRISDWIKGDLKTAITGWIGDNGERIMGVFQRLASFDWMKLASSIGHAMDNLVTTFGKVVDAVPEDALTSLITFATVYASPVGKAFSTLGAGLVTLSRIDPDRIKGIFSAITGFGGAQKGGGLITGILGGGSAIIGSMVAGFGALLAGSAAWARRKQGIEDSAVADNLLGIDPKSINSAKEFLSLIDQRKTKIAELEAEYNSLEKEMRWVGDTEQEVFKDDERARILGRSIRENKKELADLEDGYKNFTREQELAARGSESFARAMMEQNKAMDDVIDNVSEATDAYEELKTTAKEMLESQVDVFSQLQKVQNMTSAEMLGNVNDNKQAMSDYNTMLSDLYLFQQKINREGSFTDASGNVITAGQFNQALADVSEGGFADRGKLAGFWQAVLGYSTSDSMNYLYEILNGIDLTQAGMSKAEEFWAAFQMAGQGWNVEGLLGEEVMQQINSGDFEEAFGSMENAISQLESIDMSKLGETGGEAVELVKGKIEELQTAAERFSGEGGFMERLQTLQEGVDSISQTETLQDVIDRMNELNELDMSEFVSQTESMTSAQEELSGALDETRNSANYARAAIDVMANTAESRAGAFGGLVGAAYSVASAFSAAASRALALASAINSIPSSKTVTVHYSQTGAVHSGTGGRFANGGVVYASNGQLVSFDSFVPRGTDTVPAMLTPGEYVIKRSAVNNIGKTILDKVNGLDLDGAFYALMERLYMPSPRPATVTTNYNRDNHATVNVYGNNLSQGYSQRRAHRWASRL